jgi:Regulator of chromosome condensation (RCC1) repeat
MWVFGDGDCGQLGKGEDITEALRPSPLEIEGHKVLLGSIVFLRSALQSPDASKLGSLAAEFGQTLAKPSAFLGSCVGVVHHVAQGHVSCANPVRKESGNSSSRPFALRNVQVVQIACGGMHTAALTADGGVWTWGVNDEGALGRFTAGDLWEKSGLGQGEPGDPYVPGRVAFPAGTDKIVQLTAGARIDPYVPGRVAFPVGTDKIAQLTAGVRIYPRAQNQHEPRTSGDAHVLPQH